MQLYTRYYVSKNSFSVSPCNAITLEFTYRGCEEYNCVFKCSKFTLVGIATVLQGALIQVDIQFDKPLIAKLSLNGSGTQGTMILYAPGKSPITYFVNYMPTYLSPTP